DVDGADAGCRLADEVLQLVEPADVAGDGHDASGQPGALGSGGFEVFQLAAGDDNCGAGLGQATGNRFADAATAAGDQGDPAVQGNTRAHGACLSDDFPQRHQVPRHRLLGIFVRLVLQRDVAAEIGVAQN